MKQDSPERKIYEKNGIRITRYTYGWHVAEVGVAGDKAKVPGEERLEAMTFHPSLAAACEEVVLRTTDRKEAQSLQEYARNLRESIQEFRQEVERRAI